MNIYVCVKQVPDTEARVVVAGDGQGAYGWGANGRGQLPGLAGQGPVVPAPAKLALPPGVDAIGALGQLSSSAHCTPVRLSRSTIGRDSPWCCPPQCRPNPCWQSRRRPAC